MVKRYEHEEACGDEYRCGWYECSDGDYVAYTDYAQLLADNKRLKEEIRQACYQVDEIMRPFLYEGKYVDNGALTAIDKVLSKILEAALKDQGK